MKIQKIELPPHRYGIFTYMKVLNLYGLHVGKYFIPAGSIWVNYTESHRILQPSQMGLEAAKI